MIALLLVVLLGVFFAVFTFAMPLAPPGSTPADLAKLSANAHADLREERVSRKDAFENQAGDLRGRLERLEEKMKIPGSYGGEQASMPGDDVLAKSLGLPVRGGMAAMVRTPGAAQDMEEGVDVLEA